LRHEAISMRKACALLLDRQASVERR
jgi:hypothetical protein